MRYLNILLNCAAEPWAMQRDKLMEIAAFIKYKARGGDVAAEEIARITQKAENQVAKSQGDIGILPVFGVLSQRMNMMAEMSGGTSTELLGQQFRAMLADPSVKAIVMDFHSPGGTTFGMEELAAEIHASRGTKPIIAQVNSMAASAAYWLAAQADEIVVTPGGKAGSIGVYSVHEDISKFLESEGVKVTMISAGANKTLGNEFEPLSNDARATIQKSVDEANNMFVRAVARGRGVSLATVNDQFGQGLMFGATELVSRGMADKVGTMADTLERFGVQINPAMSRNRAASMQRAAASPLIEKLSAGDQPTIREWENALKGLGLSNSEAERAVRVCFKDRAQGEPEKPETGQTAVGDALAEFRKQLDGFSIPSI